MSFLKAIIWVVFLILILLVAMHCAGVLGGNDGILGGGPFRLKVSKDHFDDALKGHKEVDLRPDFPPFNKLKEGQEIVVVRSRPQGDTSEANPYKFNALVGKVTKHVSFDAIPESELKRAYPAFKTDTKSKARAEYMQYLPKTMTENERNKHSVLSISFKKSDSAKSSSRRSVPFNDYGTRGDNVYEGEYDDQDYNRGYDF